MRNILLFYFLLFSVSRISAQNSTTAWIDDNAISIEDANPDSQLITFSQNTPQNFSNARIFGFGEASHHGKEFFDLKAKFLKFLVEKQGVTLFIMEESYQAEWGINAWLRGGDGEASSIINNFGQGIWYRQEVVDLLQWMRNYNRNKSAEKQIRFYGMDNQFGKEINTRLRAYLQKHHVMINEELLAVADSCAAKDLKSGGIKKWSDRNLSKLEQLQQQLVLHEKQLVQADKEAYLDMMRALRYLIRYTEFLQDTYSQTRDRHMYENVLDILELEGAGSKAFIWAHNEHVNKQELYGSPRLKSLGRLLKDRFSEQYFSVGFDFGTGTLPGIVLKEGKISGWKNFRLDAPYPKSVAENLIQAKFDIYFLGMANAKEEPAHIFSSIHKQLMLGGPGFNPEKPLFYKRRLSDSFDAIIFVKDISPSTRVIQ